MSELIALLPEKPGAEDFRQVIAGYETMLQTALSKILERGERDGDYRFIDTKFSSVTGRDFYPVENNEIFKDRRIIYSWIQGQGLEALAGHLSWLDEAETVSPADRGILGGRIRKHLARTISAMEECRANNGGRVYFCMTPAGTPLEIEAGGSLRPAETLTPCGNYSDLYYSKGLFLAAWLLGWGQKSGEAADYFLQILKDIDEGLFQSDRQMIMSGENDVAELPESHMPLTAALSGIAAIGAVRAGEWFAYGERFIRRVIDRYVDSRTLDFVETPENRKRCYPGHALEFIGQATGCLLAMRKEKCAPSLIDECAGLFPSLFLHCFELGFDPVAGGIRDCVDLEARQGVNGLMFANSLPETMRAAAALIALDPATPYRSRLEAVMAACSNVFVKHYVEGHGDMMVYPARNAAGGAIEAYLSAPDADPGYYNGLRTIDFLHLIKKLY